MARAWILERCADDDVVSFVCRKKDDQLKPLAARRLMLFQCSSPESHNLLHKVSVVSAGIKPSAPPPNRPAAPSHPENNT